MTDNPIPLGRRLFSEGLGTAILVATVIGSGIMAERLAGGNQAIALLGNTIPTGAILVVIITILGPVFWRALQSGGDAGVCSAKHHALE
jgi:glycerol uptake facilitator-like aquaporin